MLWVPRWSDYATIRRTHVGSHGLKEAAAGAGLTFGWAFNHPLLTTYPYAGAIVEANSTHAVDGGRQGWSIIEATQGVFSSPTARNYVTWCQTRGLPLKQGGHLVYDVELPAWVTAISNAATLQAAMETHVAGVMGYLPEVRHWNVTNEDFSAVDGNPGYFRDTHLYSVLGPDYIEMALRKARQTDATAKLGINMHHLEEDSANAETVRGAFYDHIEALVAEGVPLDYIGTQMHLDPDNTITGTAVATYLEQFCDLGLDVAITELDFMDESSHEFPLATREQNIYDTTLDIVGEVCQNLSRLTHVTCWSTTDEDSWWNTAGGTRSDGKDGRHAPFTVGGAPTAFVTALRDSFALRGGVT